ncbi:unnamed protein product [Mytilus edulis]|uniref:Uncharacterized protein n=1 Tax=Mytilus edulis TaxID=6550 RepID=A0A8S3RSQ6_MYTED|nr:unnamed protein product [Mytilus edulis]
MPTFKPGDIEKEGLRRMNRQHIHLLSEVPPTFKPHWEIQIMIDVPRAQAEGYEFFWAPMLTQDQGDPGGKERGEIPGSLWFERKDTSLAAVTMASYGGPQGSWDSIEGHSSFRMVLPIDTDLENNEETNNSGASSSEGEADTTLVDEENDCEIFIVCQLRSGTGRKG